MESLSRIWFSDQISFEQVRSRISKLGYHGEIRYDPLETLHGIGKKVLGKHGCSLIIMYNLEAYAIREQLLEILGKFEVKTLMNAALKDTMLDKELTLEDAFRLTIKSIGYRKVVVFIGFLGFDNIAEFDEDGYMNAFWSVIYDTISDYYIQLHESGRHYYEMLQ